MNELSLAEQNQSSACLRSRKRLTAFASEIQRQAEQQKEIAEGSISVAGHRWSIICEDIRLIAMQNNERANLILSIKLNNDPSKMKGLDFVISLADSMMKLAERDIPEKCDIEFTPSDLRHIAANINEMLKQNEFLEQIVHTDPC